MEKANLYQQRQWGKVWTNEHGKSQGRVSFWNTEGADWRKIPVWSFPLENRKISWKVCPGLETRTYLTRSSDLDQMHRGQCLKHQQYQEAYISNHFHRWHQYIALWFLEFLVIVGLISNWPTMPNPRIPWCTVSVKKAFLGPVGLLQFMKWPTLLIIICSAGPLPILERDI